MSCVFCNRSVPTVGHHIIPKSKGFKETVEACKTCEEFIHRTWSHNLLRDTYNNVDSIKQSCEYQTFLGWLLKQKPGTEFKTARNNKRTKHKYR